MAFDKPTRNRLAAFVTEARRLITDEFTQQFQSLYGISGASLTELTQLTHLDDTGLAVAGLLRERIDYLVKTHPEDKKGFKSAVDRLAREQAFTVLNRLAAVRMAEKRGLIAESVGNGYQSKGFKVFEQVARSALGEIYQRYRRYLFCLFDELAIDLGVLFDRRSPQGLLFPRENTLLNLLNLLNGQELEPLWQEDETIGWIYQYYNDPAERKKMREESAAPRNSRELAVRNQFFTPRYVVEFLTDNTLGRIWYEMTRGETRLKEQCRYLVRRPKEVFLLGAKYFGSSAKQAILDACAGSFSGLVNLSEITWDDLQCLALAIDGYHLAQSLGLGDCGKFAHAKTQKYRTTGKWSGDAAELWCCLFFMQRRHRNDGSIPEGKDWQEVLTLFEALRHQLTSSTNGLSQEELLSQPVFIPPRPLKDPRQLRMLDPACGSMHFGLYAFDLYEVIYEEAWDQGIESLRADFPERDTLLREIPRLIIEHNIYGIDIDPRAVQIAGLSLWLRAQRSWQQQRLPARQRSRILRSNIVCAEPMPGDKAMLREFIASQFAAEEQPAFTFLLERVFDRMALAGEAGSLLKIEEEISEAVREAKGLWKKGPQYRAGYLFAEAIPKQPEQLRLDLSGISDEGFWETAEGRIYIALRTYAEQAESGSYQRRLFAEDAAQGFAFIDLCSKRYDAVLMNPPFGEPTEQATPYIEDKFPIAKKNLYIASIERGNLSLANEGRIGCITDRTYITHTRYTDFRMRYAVGDNSAMQIIELIDHGWGVLDSYVQTASAVFAKSVCEPLFCVDLKAKEDPDLLLPGIISKVKEGVLDCSAFIHDAEALRHLPNGVLAFWMHPAVVRAFLHWPSIDPSFAEARSGLSSSDNERFYKVVWEVPRNLLGDTRRWSFLSNGGEPCPFYRHQVYVIDFEKDGYMIKALAQDLYVSETRTIKNQPYYRRAGLSYGKRTENFTIQVLPAKQLFSNEGHSVFCSTTDDALAVCAFLNSDFVSYVLNCIAGLHKESGYVGNIPFPIDSWAKDGHAAELMRNGFNTVATAFRAVPENQFFDVSSLISNTHGISLDNLSTLDRDLSNTLGFLEK
jgi:hypothetical protein